MSIKYKKCMKINTFYDIINSIYTLRHKAGNFYCEIGNFYSNIKKSNQTIKYYKLAIKFGSGVAANNLASYIESDMHDDLIFADYYVEKYYKKAIELGCAHGAFNLAHYYAYTSKNNHISYRAIEYYLLAINSGHLTASTALADYYYRYNIYDLALQYYEIALRAGDDSGIPNMMELIELEEDDDNYVRYCELLASRGVISMYKHLGKFWSDYDTEKMVEYYQSGADLHCLKCSKSLAKYYINNGYLEDALHYYKKANALNKVGEYYRKIKMYSDAEKYFKSANKWKSLLYLAKLYFEQERYLMAFSYYVRYGKTYFKKLNQHRFVNDIDTKHIIAYAHIAKGDDLYILYYLVSDNQKLDFLSIVCKIYPNFTQTIKWTWYINEFLLYDVQSKYYDSLNDVNKEKINYIDILTVAKNECCSICDSAKYEVCELLCHSSHAVCKGCILKISSCPYCRKEFHA
jgi:hypothetical protein